MLQKIRYFYAINCSPEEYGFTFCLSGFFSSKNFNGFIWKHKLRSNATNYWKENCLVRINQDAISPYSCYSGLLVNITSKKHHRTGLFLFRK